MLKTASKNKSSGEGFPLIFPTATERRVFTSNALSNSLLFLTSYYFYLLAFSKKFNLKLHICNF